DVVLDGRRLELRNGNFVLDGDSHTFSAQIGIGESRSLQISADFGGLTALQSAALAALVPEPASDASFGLSFPKGEIALTAERARVLGLDGQDLAVSFGWQGGVLELDRIAGTLGGATINGRLT